jgi:hypothetical protein
MGQEIPKFALKAYAFLYEKYKTKANFTQQSLSEFFSVSMRKKVFSILVRKGWVIKKDKSHYRCNKPDIIFKSIAEDFESKR